ncbi:MAG: hypothetical protein WBP11_10510 [Dokdonella sp.]
MNYSQLSQGERCQIQALLGTGISHRSANLTPFADGETHMRQFLAKTGNSGINTNFKLDDINVVALAPPPRPPTSVVPILTMGQWSLFGLTNLAGLLGWVAVRRRQRKV